jgi:hypothetical protein
MKAPSIHNSLSVFKKKYKFLKLTVLDTVIDNLFILIKKSNTKNKFLFHLRPDIRKPLECGNVPEYPE